MASPPTFQGLAQASSQLFGIAQTLARLDEQTRHPITISTPEHTRLINNFDIGVCHTFTLSNWAEDLGTDAQDLYSAAREISQIATKRKERKGRKGRKGRKEKKQKQKQKQKEKKQKERVKEKEREKEKEKKKEPSVFHLFPCLPTELRRMIWTEAAQPPPCAHFFAKFSLAMGGYEPGAVFMEDRGLWIACKESREAVHFIYKKRRAYVAAAGCFLDEEQKTKWPGKYSNEMHWRRIARFNFKIRALKWSVHRLHKMITTSCHNIENWLADKILKVHGPVIEKVTRRQFGAGPGQKLGETVLPLEAMEKLRRQLRSADFLLV